MEFHAFYIIRHQNIIATTDTLTLENKNNILMRCTCIIIVFYFKKYILNEVYRSFLNVLHLIIFNLKSFIHVVSFLLFYSFKKIYTHLLNKTKTFDSNVKMTMNMHLSRHS